MIKVGLGEFYLKNMKMKLFVINEPFTYEMAEKKKQQDLMQRL